jgi:flagellar hook-length control protein FliK
MIDAASPRTGAKPTDADEKSVVGELAFAGVFDDQALKDQQRALASLLVDHAEQQLQADDDTIELVPGETPKITEPTKVPNQSDGLRHSLPKVIVDPSQLDQAKQTTAIEANRKESIASEQPTKTWSVTAAQTLLEGRMPVAAMPRADIDTLAVATQRQAPVAQDEKPTLIPSINGPKAAPEKDHRGGRQTAEQVQEAQVIPKPTVTATQPMTTAANISANLQDMQQKSSPLAPDTENPMGLFANDRAVSAGMQSVTSTSLMAGAETARQVAQQMAAAITTQNGRVTEIALNPEELGRVRLTMTALDNTITLNILADRPETTDLLRRHIDALAQEFRALGYDDINFSFGGDGPSDRQPNPETDHATTDVLERSETPTQTARHSNTGLDLRL